MRPPCLGPCSSRRSAGGWMRGSRAPAALLLLLVSSAVRDGAAADPGLQARCSRSCVAENCSTIGIRYGKFCGVGWTGCPGEKPCDELDACCKDHDECVEKKVNCNKSPRWRYNMRDVELLRERNLTEKKSSTRDCPLLCPKPINAIGTLLPNPDLKVAPTSELKIMGINWTDDANILGLMSVKCHEKFKNCIRKVKKAGKTGFSVECPYEIAMPTMIQGMDMAILFSQLGSNMIEL